MSFAYSKLYSRSWCPDRTLSQARRYIAESMGERFAEGVILNLEATWEESDIGTPMIGLLSMGSDPTSAIEGLAKRHGIECRAISMGQGQEVHARRLIQQSTAGVIMVYVLIFEERRGDHKPKKFYMCKSHHHMFSRITK